MSADATLDLSRPDLSILDYSLDFDEDPNATDADGGPGGGGGSFAFTSPRLRPRARTDSGAVADRFAPPSAPSGGTRSAKRRGSEAAGAEDAERARQQAASSPPGYPLPHQRWSSVRLTAFPAVVVHARCFASGVTVQGCTSSCFSPLPTLAIFYDVHQKCKSFPIRPHRCLVQCASHLHYP
jgi:hypothetical protein